MSRQTSNKAPSVPPTMDIYTGLLSVAVLALIIGCALMFWVLKYSYDFQLPS